MHLKPGFTGTLIQAFFSKKQFFSRIIMQLLTLLETFVQSGCTCQITIG